MTRTAVTVTVVLVLASCQREPATNASKRPAAEAAVPQEPSLPDDETRALFPQGLSDADFPELHHLLQVTDRIYSGSEPKTEEAFEQLAELGVKTVVSVDGARPKVELAEKHGLRYVHIPIGYDGVSEQAGKSLARLVKDAEGPFYLHCHHGVHRGPAAAAVACIADGAAEGKSALAILEKAGTSKGYAGLWRDVEGYTPPRADEELPELVSVAEVGSLAASMAIIDRASDNLKLCQAADWQTPPNHPDVAPAQEALLLKEGFRETVRQLEESGDYDEQFLAWMKESEATVTVLEAALEIDSESVARRTFTSVQNQCKRCHADYRD